jgi:PAS domain S-box-containing protein
VAREVLERAARAPDELQALLALGIRSSIVVPLAARGRTFGTITVMTAESGRTLGPDDVTFMEEIGRRAALAIDNARLYERAEAARAEAEAATEASRQLAAIVTSSADAIFSKTLEGIITSWNPAAEKMFGWTAAEAIGQHITLIIPLDRRSEEDRVLASIRRGERAEPFDTVRVAKDGRLVEISLTVSPVKDGSGRTVGASKTARDISERRRIEEERKQLLAREQAARAHAEAANRAKDEFLAMVSHELRTPLSGVYGWARMLQSSEMDAAARQKAVAAIVRNAAAQTRLIEDLLDVSRAVSGTMRLEVRPMDLRSVIEAALDAVRPAAIAKTIDIITDFEPGEMMVMGAAERLQQVVWNLVMNGVKFTPRNGRIEVRLRRTDTDAELVVADSGEGISADVLPYVFDRFRQEDSSSTRPHTGLGLGLAVVRHMIDLHGGSVAAESPGKGRGATFTVRLPLAPSGAAHPPPRRGGG